MADWEPTSILRVVEVLSSSTKPLKIETDVGTALLKYMGNPQGSDSLIAEKIAAECACNLELPVPDHAIVYLNSNEIESDLFSAESGPAFVSRWLNPAVTFSPESRLLMELRNVEVLSQLVVFDTWIKNADRFVSTPGKATENYDNLLFVPDKQKVKVVLIDHTHAFVQTTFEDEMNDETWFEEEEPLGVFPNFAALLDHNTVMSQIDNIRRLCDNHLEEIVESVPNEWHFGDVLRKKVVKNLGERAERLPDWLPRALFGQNEFNLGANS